MKKYKFIRNLFILSIITDWLTEIYETEFYLNISRSIRIFLLLFFILSSLYNFNTIRKYFLFYYYIIATIFFSIYVSTDIDTQEGIWNLSKTLFWFYGTTYFYHLLYHQKINYNFIFKWIKIIIPISTFFTFYFLLIGKLEEEYNANAYLMVFILPLFVANLENLYKHKWLLLLLIINVVITLKRGALLSLSVSLIIAYTSYILQKNVKYLARRIVFIILSVILFNLFYFIMITKFGDRISERFSEEQLNIEEDRAGSGRAGLYRNLYNEWKNSDTYTYWFGFGNQADSYRIPGRRTHAHSDFFGWLYNYGMMGLFLFILQYLFIIIHFIINYKYLKNFRFLFFIFFSVLLIVNLFSGLYRDTYTFYFFLTPVLLDLVAKKRKYASQKN